MKRLIILVCLFLMVMPVFGWVDTFQNGYATNGWNASVGGPHGVVIFNSPDPYYDSYTVNIVGGDTGVSPTDTQMFTGFGQPTTNYWSYNVRSNSAGAGYIRTSVNGVLYGNVAPPDVLPHRYEWVRNPTTGYLYEYRDGINIYSSSGAGGVDITRVGVGILGGKYDIPSYNRFYFDDFVWGTGSEGAAVVSTIPHTWSIRKNLLDPTNVGVFDGSGTLQSTTVFHIQASANPFQDGWTLATAPNTRYVLKVTSPTGVIVNQTTMNFTSLGSPSGVYAIPINSTYIGNALFEYGVYTVSLYSNGVIKGNPDYFVVTASGAVLSTDATRYGSSSTEYVNYTISSGYYTPATYSYSIDNVDLYGTTVQSIPVTSASGVVSIPLNPSSYPAGVYYTELVATSLTAPYIKYVMAYAPIEVTGYVYFTGFVLNAETTATISNVAINVTQGTTTLSSLSMPTGAWNSSSGSWLTGSPITIVATKTGYDTYTNILTPLVAKTLNITIPMMPTVKTCTGVCIGGVVKDTIYGNPITGATYHVKNSTEYTATTNIAGYARVDSLTSGVLYDVWSTKTGYNISAVEQKLAVGV